MESKIQDLLDFLQRGQTPTLIMTDLSNAAFDEYQYYAESLTGETTIAQYMNLETLLRLCTEKKYAEAKGHLPEARREFTDMVVALGSVDNWEIGNGEPVPEWNPMPFDGFADATPATEFNVPPEKEAYVYGRGPGHLKGPGPQKKIEVHPIKGSKIKPPAGFRNLDEEIEDLTPMSLSRQFYSLYEVEWERAYDELGPRKKDTEKVKTLLWVLQDAFKSCSIAASRQIDEIQKSCEIAMVLSKAQLEKIKDPMDDPVLTYEQKTAFVNGRALLRRYRCVMAVTSLPELTKRFLANKAGFIGKRPNCERYARNCVKVCWKLRICDQPLIIEDVQHGKYFDTELFTVYNKAGNDVDFCVWPALKFEGNGMLLKKGVAEGLSK